MLLTLLKAKLHRACITGCDMHYEGSIAIDCELMQAVGLIPHEKVDVWNINNGKRISTYVISAPAGSRQIAVNGAAAHHFDPEDRVIITAFAEFTQEEAGDFTPNVIILDQHNNIVPHSP